MRCGFLNPNGLTIAGKPWLFTVGGNYDDQLVRTREGWRIAVGDWRRRFGGPTPCRACPMSPIRYTVHEPELSA